MITLISWGKNKTDVTVDIFDDRSITESIFEYFVSTGTKLPEIDSN